MRIEEALEKYLAQIAADGRSTHTQRQAERHIRKFASWLREEGRSTIVERVDHEVVAAFLGSWAARTRPDGRTKRATSVNALRSSVRTFFDYLCRAGYIERDPARLVRRARCGSPPPRAISEDEQMMLLDTVAKASGPEAERDYMLIDLLLSTGLRIGSALALDAGDVDMARAEMTVRKAKNDRPDVFPLGKRIRDHLHSYLAGRLDGPLFANSGGRRISTRHAARRLRMWVNRAGIARRVSAHDLRHSFGQRVYEASGGDLLLTQAALGHASITSTTVYARCDRRRLRSMLLRETPPQLDSGGGGW